MQREGTDHPDQPSSNGRPRYIFQVDSASDGAVIRVLDTRTDTVFREIPVEEFLEFARSHRDVRSFFLRGA